MRYQRNTIAMAAMLTVMMVGMTACGAQQSTNTATNASAKVKQANTPVVMKDDVGHKVTIPANPTRVLAPFLEDELVTLGIKPVAQLALGQDVQSSLQTQLKNVPILDMSSGLDPEKVLSFNPDLILLNNTALATGNKYAQLAKIAPTYVFKYGAQDWRQTLLTMGKMFHKTNKAKQAIQNYDQEAQDASAKIHKAIGNKTVAVLWVDGKSIYIVTKDWFSGQVLYGDMGLTPPKVADVSGDNGFPPISMEKIPSMHADYIFLVSDSKSAANWVVDDPVWKSLPAVQAGHSYMVSYGNWVQTSGVIANTQTIKDALADLTK
ncbi:ABC transporter substrate-binding protein [Alicyclobacillus fodiniaquatilis]|uniref:ABC transporter substrate-binding protein n=1 Tax=Alicyclobacillus fodiniaquatilis TaxID=1661150 RepID=A0ABW4JMV8_9BACL